MARRRTRARSSPRPRKKAASGNWWLWVPVLALAGGLGWLWYRTSSLPWQEAASEPDDPPGYSEPVVPATPDFESETADTSGRSTEPPAPAPAPARPAVPGPPTVASPPPTASNSGPPSASVSAANGATDDKVKAPASKVLAVQLALLRRGISAGPVDGVVGTQTQAALRAFQRREGLPVTGGLDAATLRRLDADEGNAYTAYTVTAEDLTRLTSVPRSWLEKSTRSRLDYETVLELVSEKAHAHPRLIRQLNPQVDWNHVAAGTVVRIPAASLPAPRGRAAFVRISLGDKVLRAFDSQSNLLVQFPCSIARKVEKRPVGELRVARLAPNPNYRFDPDIFPESPEARKIGRKLMIPPGPNNPVGTAWIGLDRPGYGIHGTPQPEDVGRTESHGCFRLANWNAEYLLKLAWVGMPIHVEP